MILYPNAKINLGLHIVEKNADGFHNIETLFFPLRWSDVLEFVPIENTDEKTSLKCTGLSVAGNSDNNLVMKALQIVKSEYKLPELKIHLHKIIPMGAGLGGGSADASYMLVGLNRFFDLKITNDKLSNMAAKIGSDCAFFINNQPSLGTGRGNILEAFNIKLSGKYLLVAVPDVHVSTPQAYAGVKPQKPTTPLKEILKMDISEWKKHLINDFEISVFDKFPTIAKLKEIFYEKGAIYASMSGSGSSVFGIFDKNPNLEFTELNGKGWKEQIK